MHQSEEHDDLLLVVTFFLSDRLLGIPTDRIQEIIKIGAITAVPHAPGHITGILNLRGKIVTVIDLGMRLSCPPVQQGELARIIILEDGGESVGLLVDRVADVLRVDPRDLTPPPPNMQAMQKDFFESIYRFPGGVVGVLAIDAVLSAD